MAHHRSPPTWRYDVTDLRAFSKWSRKVQIWEMQIKTYMTPREASLLLYNSLSGEAEAELEHAPLEKINSDSGIQYILESLKAPMEQKAVFQKRKFLSGNLADIQGKDSGPTRTDAAAKGHWKLWESVSPACMIPRPGEIACSSVPALRRRTRG